MIAGVADTHTAIWYIFNDARLSATARTFIETTAANGNQIGVSSITLIEMVYLIEKGKIAAESLTRMVRALDDPGNVFIELPVDLPTARALSGVDVSIVSDMPDRVVVATAQLRKVPVISRDSKIQALGMATIW